MTPSSLRPSAVGEGGSGEGREGKCGTRMDNNYAWHDIACVWKSRWLHTGKLLVLLINIVLSNHRPLPLPKILRLVEERLPRVTQGTWVGHSGNQEGS